MVILGLLTQDGKLAARIAPVLTPKAGAMIDSCVEFQRAHRRLNTHGLVRINRS
jgi:hypothetical protein